jgi:hypothetical protein
MATPVNDFQDILDAMERNPALRDLMRSHILGDELMKLPARFIQLQEQVDSIQASVNRLEEGQARLEQGLADTNARLEQGLADTNARIDSLTGEFRTANGRLNNLIGADYESHVATYVHRALRRSKGIHATVLSTQKDKSALARILDEAEFQGLIQPWETDELDNADLVLTAQGPSEYLLAEVSVTVEQEDINRASQRALLLAKATGRTVAPFAIGAREKPDLQRGDVQVVIIPEP